MLFRSITKPGWKATIQCMSSGPVPTVNFTASQTNICESNTVTYTDNSTNNPTSWSWNFPGGSPSSSSLQNPTVTYTTAGIYDATLTASNQYGSTSLTKSAYITVNGLPAAPGTPTGNTLLCMGAQPTASSTTGAPGATTYIWSLERAAAGSGNGNTTSADVTWNGNYSGSAMG